MFDPAMKTMYLLVILALRAVSRVTTALRLASASFFVMGPETTGAALLISLLIINHQSFVNRLRNALLFTIKHSLRVLAAVAIQLVWLALMILLAPWTLVAVPFLGFWFPIFLAQYRIYADLNRDLRIEAQFIPIEGDPWREDSFQEGDDEDAEPDPMSDGTRHWEALMRDIERNKEGQR